MTAAEIGAVIDVPKATVDSWTRDRENVRNPSPVNKKKIEALYEDLKPCLLLLKTIKDRTPMVE